MLFVLSVASLMGFIYMEQGKQSIDDVVININHAEGNGFLTEMQIKEMIIDYDSIINKPANQINTFDIENKISKNPFVALADAYINIDKDLIINIEEKHPFARIYNRKNDGFYIDYAGNIFPLSKSYTARVIIINGYIDVKPLMEHPNIYDTVYVDTQLADLLDLCKLISANNFLNAQIGQIYVNSRHEFDLIPQLGNHLIKFGTMDDASIKLDNLDVFYKKALIGEGWDKYEIINLKYKNQVVCKRK